MSLTRNNNNSNNTKNIAQNQNKQAKQEQSQKSKIMQAEASKQKARESSNDRQQQENVVIDNKQEKEEDKDDKDEKTAIKPSKQQQQQQQDEHDTKSRAATLTHATSGQQQQQQHVLVAIGVGCHQQRALDGICSQSVIESLAWNFITLTNKDNPTTTGVVQVGERKCLLIDEQNVTLEQAIEQVRAAAAATTAARIQLKNFVKIKAKIHLIFSRSITHLIPYIKAPT